MYICNKINSAGTTSNGKIFRKCNKNVAKFVSDEKLLHKILFEVWQEGDTVNVKQQKKSAKSTSLK